MDGSQNSPTLTLQSTLISPPLLTPRSSLNRSNDLNTPWSNLLRPSLLGPNTPIFTQSQTSQSQSQSDSPPDSHTTFTFCQNRLLSSTQDLSKMIQTVSNTLTDDKTSLETLLASTRTLIDSIREENITHHNQNMKNSPPWPQE
jgi:hypothetical protein